MTSITRKQLRAAIEAGITAAENRAPDFRPEYAAALRAVADRAMVVARGEFVARPACGDEVRCPVARAFSDWEKRDWTWDLEFTSAFDRATRDVVNPLRQFPTPNILQVTDDSTEGGAA